MGYKTLQDPQFAGLANYDPRALFAQLPTPAYVIDEERLRKNGEVLAALAERTGCRVLLAQKAFSNYDFYPLLSRYLAGTEASGLYEARLGKEEMPQGEVHVFCGAYREDEFQELLQYADHIVFNSIHQLKAFGPRGKQAGKSLGLRVNPECSTQEGHAIYDPCAPGSRMGVTRNVWDQEMDEATLSLLDGIHFHTLCEQNSDDLKTTLAAVEEKFGDILPEMKWINMGGGHHITRPDYDLGTLENCIRHAQQSWGVNVYLEPGEAVALNAGYLASRVLDVVENGGVRIAILDVSAACHMPDVLEMPYQPPILGASTEPGEGHMFRLAGPTCLAGDVIGDYDFDRPLQEGDLVLLGDMAIYTTCKNNTFNGMPLPNLWKLDSAGGLEQLTPHAYTAYNRGRGRGRVSGARPAGPGALAGRGFSGPPVRRPG